MVANDISSNPNVERGSHLKVETDCPNTIRQNIAIILTLDCVVLNIIVSRSVNINYSFNSVNALTCMEICGMVTKRGFHYIFFKDMAITGNKAEKFFLKSNWIRMHILLTLLIT